MTTFLLTAAALAVLALVLLTRPFWLRSATLPSGADDSAELRGQLEQLTSLHKSGVLGKAQFNEARVGLERRIAATTGDKRADATPEVPRASKGLLLGLSGFVCAVAATGYMLLGTPLAVNPDWVAQQVAPGAESGHSIAASQIETMTEKLAARLKEQPDDADGWAMLGRSYAVLGRHDQAAPAFKQAMVLRPDDAAVLADYADALAVVNGRNLEGEPSRLIDRALKIDPNNLKALALAGSAAFYRKDYAGALRYWEKMAQLAPNSDFVQQIQGGIDEARKLMGGPSVATAAAQPATTARATSTTGASVSGTVTLAASLAGKASPDDALFVFARPAEGPRMPLAMIRKQVRDLPLTFKLDDSMAMSPAARLSSAERVVVGARISKRGDATAQPGDLQGLSAPVSPGAAGLKLEISEVVKP
jgi:cytochrome c-type biogenesis protein CcmH